MGLAMNRDLRQALRFAQPASAKEEWGTANLIARLTTYRLVCHFFIATISVFGAKKRNFWQIYLYKCNNIGTMQAGSIVGTIIAYETGKTPNQRRSS
jgi:hypothetical protein